MSDEWFDHYRYHCHESTFEESDDDDDDDDGDDDDDESVEDERFETKLLRSMENRREHSALSLPWVRRGLIESEYSSPMELEGYRGNGWRRPAVTLRSTGTTIAGVVVVLSEQGDVTPPNEILGDGGPANDSESEDGDSTRSIRGAASRTRKRSRRRMAVVLGSDTRATSGSLVADKNASKIHPLACNLYACGAGTSADLLHLTRQARYTLRWIHQSQFESVGNANATIYAGSRNDGNDDPDVFVNVPAACRWIQDALYSQAGSCQANLIVGGLTGEGTAVLRAIHPHGSMDVDLPYAALGSGGLAAMSVLESRYRPHMSLDGAVQLVKDAIMAGIRNDLGSGSAIDLCVLDSEALSAVHIRSSVPEEALYPPRPAGLLSDLSRGSSSHLAMENADTEVRETNGFESLERRESELGANGFGNVPIRIRSARTIQRFGEEEKLASDWDELLGLSPPRQRPERKG
jgi:20S proteasome subunit beta 2